MTNHWEKSTTGGITNLLHVESGNFLYDDGRSTGCQTTTGKIQHIFWIGSRVVITTNRLCLTDHRWTKIALE